MIKIKSLNTNIVIRIVTLPYLQYSHRLVDGERYSRIPCSKFFSDSVCPVCETGNAPTKNWLLGVVDKTTGKYGVCQIGRKLFVQLQQFTRGMVSIHDGIWNCDIRVGAAPRAESCPTFTLLKPEFMNLDGTRPDGYKEELLKFSSPIGPEEAAKLLEDFNTFGCFVCEDCHDFCGQKCQIGISKQQT